MIVSKPTISQKNQQFQNNALVTLTMALEAVAEAASKAAALFLIDEKVEPFSFPL